MSLCLVYRVSAVIRFEPGDCDNSKNCLTNAKKSPAALKRCIECFLKVCSESWQFHSFRLFDHNCSNLGHDRATNVPLSVDLMSYKSLVMADPLLVEATADPLGLKAARVLLGSPD